MPQTIGLIAGNGAFPALFARAARARGFRIVAVALRGETEPGLEALVDVLIWVRVGQLGRMIDALVAGGVREVAMAGGLDKRRLFGRARPDWLGLRVLARALVRHDDGMLRAVARELEGRGLTVVASTRYLPEALAPAGVLTRRRPSEREALDLRYGFKIAKEIGRLDIGQTVVVRAGAVVALEAIEGTDACIARGGALAGGEAVVIKIAKPNQDLRFDLPAVGPGTIASLAAAGIRVLGIEAGRTLMLDAGALLAAADRHGISVVGLDGDAPVEAPEAPAPAVSGDGP